MPADKTRCDKWLWQARFFKTRTLASKLVTGGHLRVNSARVSKASYMVGVGDTLTFPQARQIRVVQISALAQRRGPASEAQTLYQDLTPIEDKAPYLSKPVRKGRPSKQDRRNARLLRGSYLD